MDHSVIMTRARTRLLLDSPWFGSLAMRLRFDATRADVQTLATDGTSLFYSPEFVASLPDAELTACIAHEVMHCALLHPFRRGSRDLKLWNQATDFVITSELVAAGFRLPADVLIDPKYNGLSAETAYAQLSAAKQQDQQQGQGKGQQGQQQAPAPLSTGTVEDAPQPGQPGQQGTPAQGQGQQPQAAPAPSDQPMSEDDWKVATEQSNAVSKLAGSLPGGAMRAAKLARESREDWRAILREFIEHTQPSDYSWSTPNRRHIADGLYLPGVTKENLGTIAVAVDTSGSISQRLLDCFASELTAIVREARPESVHVIYCDSRVRHTDDFTADDSDITLKAHGGGGTKFSPVFAHVAEMATAPACFLYFTDLDCYDKPTEPDYPVLWVTGQDVTRRAPFGRTVRIDLNA